MASSSQQNAAMKNPLAKAPTPRPKRIRPCVFSGVLMSSIITGIYIQPHRSWLSGGPPNPAPTIAEQPGVPHPVVAALPAVEVHRVGAVKHVDAVHLAGGGGGRGCRIQGEMKGMKGCKVWELGRGERVGRGGEERVAEPRRVIALNRC